MTVGTPVVVEVGRGEGTDDSFWKAGLPVGMLLAMLGILLGVDSVRLIEGISLGNSLTVGTPVPFEVGREVGTSDSFWEAGLLLGLPLAIVMAVGTPVVVEVGRGEGTDDSFWKAGLPVGMLLAMLGILLGVASVRLIEGISLGNSLTVGTPVPFEVGREVGTSDSFREAGLLLGLPLVLGRVVGTGVVVPRLQVLFTTQIDIKLIGSPVDTEKFPMSALPVLSAPPHFQ
jgi:hypothetical protein